MTSTNTAQTKKTALQYAFDTLIDFDKALAESKNEDETVDVRNDAFDALQTVVAHFNEQGFDVEALLD